MFSKCVEGSAADSQWLHFSAVELRGSPSCHHRKQVEEGGKRAKAGSSMLLLHQYFHCYYYVIIYIYIYI